MFEWQIHFTLVSTEQDQATNNEWFHSGLPMQGTSKSNHGHMPLDGFSNDFHLFYRSSWQGRTITIRQFYYKQSESWPWTQTSSCLLWDLALSRNAYIKWHQINIRTDFQIWWCVSFSSCSYFWWSFRCKSPYRKILFVHHLPVMFFLIHYRNVIEALWYSKLHEIPFKWLFSVRTVFSKVQPRHS